MRRAHHHKKPFLTAELRPDERYSITSEAFHRASQGDMERAGVLFRHALESNFRNPRAWIGYGMLQRSLKKYSKAMTCFLLAREFAASRGREDQSEEAAIAFNELDLEGHQYSLRLRELSIRLVPDRKRPEDLVVIVKTRAQARLVCAA